MKEMNDFNKRISNLSPEKRALLEQRLLKKSSFRSDQNRISRRGTSGPCVLSFGQERLWLYDQIEPDMPNIIHCPLRVTGKLDRVALEKALNTIVDRHEILRTTFSSDTGEPLQIVNPNPFMEMSVIDRSMCPGENLEAEMYSIIHGETLHMFDLSKDLMLRAVLLRLSDSEHILILTMHHIASDGWSLGVFFQELAALYTCFSEGKPSSLDEMPVQYADYAYWQRHWMKGEVLERQLSYWKGQLVDIPPALALPTDRPRPVVRSLKGSSVGIMLPKMLVDRLRDLITREGVTMFTLMMAAFRTLLYRFTGQKDICVGTFSANRNRVELEKMIGFFVNTLIMRTSLSGSPSFVELLQREHESSLNAFAHQDIPFEKILEAVNPDRTMSHTPLFQVSLAFQDMPKKSFELPNLKIELMDPDTSVSLYDLSLIIDELKESIYLGFTYRTDIFDASTIERWIHNFQTLLEGIAANPEVSIETLPLLTESEKRQIVAEWNNNRMYCPGELCIHEVFEAQVEKTPDAVAVFCDGQELTYRELNDRANRVAHYLRKEGVGPEKLVGICVERSPEMIMGLLGILKAGGAYVPLDPAYPQERLKLMLEDADVSVLLTQEHLCMRLPLQKVKPVCLDTHWDKISWESHENPSNVAVSSNTAYVIYTSGSTGRPKGVVVEHKSLVNYVMAAISQYGLRVSDRILQFASVSFDASAEEIYPCLAYGATLVLRTDEMLNSVRDFLHKCVEWKLTVLSLPTIYWHELIWGLKTEKLKMPDTIRLMIIGGENASPESLMHWKEQVDTKVQLLNTYGPTEATVVATMCDLTHVVVLHGEQIPIGQPMPNVQTYILDPFLQPVPIGVSGELYIGGNGLARGHLNRPELTAEKFIPNPFSDKPGARLYRTGDLARYLPGGNIEFLGRIDDQVKIRGFRIEPGEIEAALRRHPAVRETIVIAREDRPGNKRLTAYIVHDKKSAVTNTELRSFLKEKLPDYMVPSAFVILDSLPLTPSGKVNRKALPKPETERSQYEKNYAGTRNAVEEILADIWADVLELDKIGIHDNFFELGGHSLLATQVLSRLRNAIQIEIPLRRLFETPTIAGLAEVINANIFTKEPQSASLIMPVPRDMSLPLSFAQERLWFLYQLEPDNSAYNISFALRLTGQLNVIVLEESFGEILRRHEVLRTTFITDDDRPVQRISPAGDFTLLKVDISDMQEEQRKIKVLELANEEASKPFDLTEGPLLRATLLRLSRQEHVLFLTVHHIVSDGWSMGIIYRELSALYEAFSKGNPSPLPDLPIQYADFAVWQRQWLQGQRLERQLSFWKEHLKGASMLELASDYPRPSVQTFNGALHTLQFPKTLTESLHYFSRKEGVTLFMVLLAAFQTLLHRYTGQSDIVVGTPIANRNHEAIEGLIGFFVNTLVMRIDTSGNPSFRELLKRVLKNTLDAYAHQDMPFEKLVENLQPERDLSRTPFFQVMFSLQNVPYSSLKLPGLTLSPMEIENVMTRFDLEVHLWETEEGLKGGLVYNTNLFDASNIARMAGHFVTLLDGIVVNPEQRLSDLPLLPEEERYQLLFKWNNTGEDYPRDKCIHELFEEQVERNPDAIAVIFGEKQLTYRQLNTRANQLARYLIKHGVGPEVLVGICVEQSTEMIIGVLGILKAGGAYVPLDPTYPKERLAFILKDTKSPLILTQKRLHSVLPEHTALAIFLDSDLDNIEKENNTIADNKTSADNLAYVIYTSGSTGKPKGVCIPHRAVNRLVMNTNYIKFDSSDRIAHASSFSFDAATFELWGALLNGACLIGVSRDVILSPEDFSRQISASRITVLFLTTALFNQIARQIPAAFKSLRYLLFGGEAVDPACVRMVVNAGPPRRLLHVYGPTENTTFTSWYPVEDVSAYARTIPIGRPVSNTTIYILDRAFQPVPIGVPGELYTGGEGLARGYLNRPELNAKKFIPNLFCEIPETRLYKTGDLARFLPNGNIEFLGRIDHQVKIRGFRIEPGEIEAVLGHHPAVREAVVTVREDQPGDKRLVAYIVSEKNPATTIIELQEFLKRTLPDYMVPSVFVHLDTLPLTVNGKVNRKALPSPDKNIGMTARVYVAPRNKLEIQLTEIWEKILGLHPIGVTDNFFDLGGHSLLAVRLTSEIRKITSNDFPVMALFHNQTIEQLAEIIAAKRWSMQWSSAVPIHIGGSKKPLFSVHDTNLARFLEPDQPFYILTHPTKDENLAPYRTVEKIAANNLKEMRTIQPQGPYRIGGFCFWAVVALEMAHQLTEQGEEVSFLFLVDPSDIIEEKQTLQDTKLEYGSVHHNRKVTQKIGEKIYSLLRKTFYAIKRTKHKSIIMIKVAICEMYIRLGHPLPYALQSFYFSNYYVTKIMKSYIPKIYPGKAVLFFSDKIPPCTVETWNDLITGGVENHEVSSAEHLNILREPYVNIWARTLNLYLEKIQEEEDGKSN